MHCESSSLLDSRLYSFFSNSIDDGRRAPRERGFLSLPGFEAVYAVAGLLVVAYLVMQRRKLRKAKFIAHVKSWLYES
jgi:PGF-CTERM protein